MPTQTIVQTPNTLPDALAALGVVREFDPAPPERLRIAISGQSGKGKSTFINSIPNCLVLDFDGGSHSVLRPHAYRVTIKDYKHYMDLMDVLISQAKTGKRTFNHIAIDSVNKWSQLLDAQIAHEKSDASKDKHYTSVAEYGQEGAGYAILRTRCMFDLNALHDHGYAWVAVCHSAEKEVTIGEKKVSVIRPTVFPSLVGCIFLDADVVGEIRIDRRIERKMVKRTLTIPGRGEQVIEQAVEEPVTNYVLELEPKSIVLEVKRRLATINGDVVLPSALDVATGWDAFANFYREKIEEARQLVAGDTPAQGK